jgi:histidyl-tRNA synthetase
MQLLPGFRDFYPDDCARRNYILATWREVARRYGFVEYDGPVLEPISLYEKKSGGELVGQLFDFVDKGERHVAMRPEMTPTLARMVAARERDFKKPMKWFCCPQFFRYEKQQRGRLREFYQFNADIIGEALPAADAELIALTIDLLKEFGFDENDFVIRLSSREIWWTFLQSKAVNLPSGINYSLAEALLAIVDKADKQDDSVTNTQLSNTQLARFNLTIQEIRQWASDWEERIYDPSYVGRGTEIANIHNILHVHLASRDLLKYVKVDFSIVRGLAYYTGVVFEVFDKSKKERALAGGGRYDKLLSLMSDGKVDLPALGFGMGDVVLANLINDTPHAKAKMDAWIAQHHACNIYVVIAKEERRADALAIVQQLRDAGLRVDFPLTDAKVGKQFQTAEHLGARLAVLVGDEWPNVKIKTLATREEVLVPAEQLAAHLAL